MDTMLTLSTCPDALAIDAIEEKIYLLDASAQCLTAIDVASRITSECHLENCPLRNVAGKQLTCKHNLKANALYFANEGAHEIFKLDLNTHKFETPITIIPSVESIDFCHEAALVASFEATQGSSQCVNFDASATQALSPGHIDYFWDFGDGFEEFTEHPSTAHIYENSGEYTAGLTVAREMPRRRFLAIFPAEL